MSAAVVTLPVTTLVDADASVATSRAFAATSKCGGS
jgi:hypothetical protein